MTPPSTSSPGPLLLSPALRHYDWGGTAWIPSLLGQPNLEGRPFAEMWMGAHPDSPSFVKTSTEGQIGLDAVIAQNPENILGHETFRDYGGLPFLLKVLDVARPLSIQVHPSLVQARAGFEDEESRRVPRFSPERRFKDPYSKPELVVAMGGPLWALCGFRPLEEIRRFFEDEPEGRGLADSLPQDPEGLRSFYRAWMEAPSERGKALWRPWVDRWRRENARAPFSKEDRRFWVLRADEIFSKPGALDRGLLAMLLLNLVRLNPGEGMFVPTGTLHSYLEGTALEIMGNSDNVFRGGLTHKPVDVPHLLKAVSFGEETPWIVSPQSLDRGEWVYPTSAAEFELSRLELEAGTERGFRPAWSGEIYFVAEGSVELLFSSRKLSIQKGQSVFVPRGERGKVRSSVGATVFRAGTPWVKTFRGRRPVELGFGTSGLRGRVVEMTDLEVYVNTRGFLRYVAERTGTVATVPLGMDLRPSSPRVARAVARAIVDEQGIVDPQGFLPTPALGFYAFGRGQASVMVTGSHIPFDRNGIKFCLSSGEVLKADEAPILRRVAEVRAEEYNRSVEESPFDAAGFFRPECIPAPFPENAAAREAYRRRFLDFFPEKGLRGNRLAVYQHSAVGRDLLVEILEALGAEVVAVGRSDEFVPIDTEDISEGRLEDLRRMVSALTPRVDALLSTDGDSDRPLVCGVDAEGFLSFFPGDLLGPLAAEYLEADGVVAPISVNDLAGRFLGERLRGPTRIGSPFVIDGMRRAAVHRGRVVGYEANGGFLVQQDLTRNGRRLAALPTRDAVLPLLCVLFSAKERGLSLSQLFARLPRRFGKAGLLDNFPTESSTLLLRRLSPSSGSVTEVDFDGNGGVTAREESGAPLALGADLKEDLLFRRSQGERLFTPALGFAGGIRRINFLDGVRFEFGNGDVAHVRPSGNAPQLRVYACADSTERAQEIVRWALRELEGFSRGAGPAVFNEKGRFSKT